MLGSSINLLFITLSMGACLTQAPSFNKECNYRQQETITDIQNTRWQINQSPTLDTTIQGSLNFKSDNVSFNYLQMNYEDLLEVDCLWYKVMPSGNPAYTAYQGGWMDEWYDQELRTIEIETGTGNLYSNNSFITWLNNNATYLGSIGNDTSESESESTSTSSESTSTSESEAITDLSNTTWLLNNQIDVLTNDFTTDISYYSNNRQYNYIAIGNGILNYSLLQIMNESQVIPARSDNVYTANGGWTNEGYKLITFRDQGETTDTDLINWLYANAVYQGNQDTSQPNPNDNTGIVDIPGVMFDIIAMPFTFISQAFNLTIFPGTAYEVTFSNIVLIVLCTLILLFIIRLIMKGKS